MKILAVCDWVIRVGYILLFAMVPLLVTAVNYELFEFNKMMAVYALTAVIVGAWVIKMGISRQIRITRTPLDVPILLFLLSQAVSAVFSLDPHVSWFGYYSRFNGGMWSVIAYVALYYTFVTTFTPKEETLRLRSEQAGDKRQETGKHQIPNKHSSVHTVFSFHPFLLKTGLVAAIIISLWGVLEHFGYSMSCYLFTSRFDVSCWVQDVQNRVFATLGQPNWMAAYIVALMPLSIAFGLQFLISNFPASPARLAEAMAKQAGRQFLKEKRTRGFLLVIGYWSLVILFFLVLLYTRSRSGLLGFVAADVIFWSLILILLHKSSLWKSLRLPFVMLHVSFVILIFFQGTGFSSIDRYISLNELRQASSVRRQITNKLSTSSAQTTDETAASKASSPPSNAASTYTAPLLEFGGTESGTIRKYVWQGAITAWKSSVKTILIGTGTETFAFAFYQFRPRAHNLTSEWDFLYNKAHNEYLNYLATTGLFGLGSYMLYIGSFIFWFIKFKIFNSQFSIKISNFKFQIENINEKSRYTTLVAIGLFAGWISLLVTNFFGFSVVATQLFFFLFPAMIIALEDGEGKKPSDGIRIPLSPFFGRLVAGTSIFFSLVILILVSLIWYADTLFAKGYRYNRTGNFEAAQQLIRSAKTFNPIEPFYSDELATALAGGAIEALTIKDATSAANLAQESLQYNDRALRTSPNNVNFWKTRTKLYYSFSQYDAAMTDAATAALEKASLLSPNDPKIIYNLAILYGRTDNTAKAIDTLKTAIDLKANYRDAYYALFVFYTESNEPDQARQVLQTYLAKVDPNDKDFLSRTEQK